MASFDTVNYSTRVKKNIERKIMVELFYHIDRQYRLFNHRYIGMGSIWFADFLLFHRAFGFTNMLSIEKDDIGYSRARFNQPFGFVKIKQGDVGTVLPDELRISTRPRVIAWLDYDYDIGFGIVSDLKRSARLAKPGDIFLVTADANPEKLRVKLQSKPREKLSSWKRREFVAKQAAFNKHAESLVTLDKEIQLEKANYPKLIAAALIEALNSGCNAAGRGIKFKCIFNFFYADKAPMVTIGGIVEQDGKEIVVVDELRERLFYVQGKNQVSIDVPLLTTKEKLKIDSTIISKNGALPTSHALGFKLEPDMTEKYVTYYNYYPLFGEVLY